jgi:hypothetical protein
MKKEDFDAGMVMLLALGQTAIYFSPFAAALFVAYRIGKRR